MTKSKKQLEKDTKEDLITIRLNTNSVTILISIQEPSLETTIQTLMKNIMEIIFMTDLMHLTEHTLPELLLQQETMRLEWMVSLPM